jgi:alginate O-acetyltransferase complex protein AlgI
MLFNSFEFFFLLIIVLVAVIATRAQLRHRIFVLNIASLFFYSWWNPEYTLVLLASACFNYLLSSFILKHQKYSLISLGIAFNLLAIGVFKYGDFFIDNINLVSGSAIPPLNLTLPLGISFYTFEQIAFLVCLPELNRSDLALSRSRYFLFVSFFPHLIAGPIIQPKAFFRQLDKPTALSITASSAARGVSLFIIGLAKKVLIADLIAPDVQLVFRIAEATGSAGFFDAWTAALLYAFQIYFDFSGYTDMALGLARVFNITLPENFNSPYRATSITDFWRRWHMSLSAFLREYLYIPLGGNRHGQLHQYLNILVVMFLGGLWHGAGWTFAIWGVGHGILIVINHLWRRLREFRGIEHNRSVWAEAAGRFATFIAVVALWVPFRSPSFDVMAALFKGMLGLNGILPLQTAQHLGMSGWKSLLLDQQPIFGAAALLNIGAVVVGLYAACNILPNTSQLFSRYHDGFPTDWWGRFCWRPNIGWLAACFLAWTISASLIICGSRSEFLYFQF